MKKIKIGHSNLEIMPFNLGGNVFGWTVDEKKSFEILDAYSGAGFDFIDTADTYSHWANGGVGGAVRNHYWKLDAVEEKQR